MPENIYSAEFLDVDRECVITLRLDLGFGVLFDQDFLPFGVDIGNGTEHNEERAVQYVFNRLRDATEIYVKSYKIDDGCYLYAGDISFKIGSAWFNLSKSLLENGLAYARE